MTERDQLALSIKQTRAMAPADINMLSRALSGAGTPEEVRSVEHGIDMYESYMRAAGLRTLDQIRPVNETRMRARWKLGRLLAEVERATHPGKGKVALTSLTSLLAELDLTPPTALAAQRIGTLPEAELEKALAEARANQSLVAFADLIVWARPYWYQESRQQRHRDIAAGARMTLQNTGPFPLIYADPPWLFEIYSPKGLERTPDQHYPTLTDQEIIDFQIAGLTVPQIAHENAALFLWCTSSNLKRALAVMAAWDFEFKTSAAWDKQKTGLGLVFRNRHEILLYGTRGDMPGPQFQPSSVFRYLRGRHSAKPPEIRREIEKMYPDFDARTRLELFAREPHDGWTVYGFEADSKAVA